MLKVQSELHSLRLALAALTDDAPSPCPWRAVRALAKLAAKDGRLIIDMRATEIIGAPLVVLLPEKPDAERLKGLSPRERDVASGILLGWPNKKIAATLGISVGTVKDHVHRILGKTGSKSRAELAARLRPTDCTSAR